MAHTETTTDRPTQQPTEAGSLDMIDPVRAGALLKADQDHLLALVNDGHLAAYQLGDHVRFRYRDVESLASRRAIAA